jgi:hypothetical protein
MNKTASSGHLFTRVAGAAMLAGACALLAGPVAAQGASPVVLLLDQDAIAPAKPPNSFLPTGVNATIAAAGVRDFLPFFNGKAGQSLVLPGGEVGHDGWFALESPPASWDSSPGTHDGLQNFILAGAGLGSPDHNGDRQSLLDGIPDVTPLRAAGLQMLIGQRVCALVYAGDIPWTAATTSLRGANLGLVAFTVVSVVGGDALTLPSVEVRLLDPDSTCSEPLMSFVNAPDPG